MMQFKRYGSHVLAEVDGLSRDDATLTGGVFVDGEVVGQLDNGHHTKLNLAADAADAQEAVAVVLGDVDASALDRPGVVHARLTSVREKALVWPSGITPEQKAAALRQLAARNIIARY